MTWIYFLPSWLFFIIVVVAMAALAAGWLLVFRRVIPIREELAHNDVAGPIIGTIGTILAIVLSFLLIGNWQQYDAAAATVAQEAAAVADLYHGAAYFPEPVRSGLQNATRAYVGAVIDEEWPAMRTGGHSPEVERQLLAMLRLVAQYNPQTPAQQALQQTAFGLVNAIADGRRTRLFDNDEGIPLIFWAGNVLLAVITIGFCCLFRVRNEWLHLAMTSALAMVIGVIFVLTAELDYPFRGDNQLSPLTFLRLQQTIAKQSLDQTNGTR
jgi:hypothetical protein